MRLRVLRDPGTPATSRSAAQLAINAHGSAIPATGETMLSGQTYGSLLDLIHPSC